MVEIGGTRGLFGGLLLLLVVSAVVSNYEQNSNRRDAFVGAVYEHVPVTPSRIVNISRYEALQVIQDNLDIYSETVREAERSRVDIIVFPEYGLFGVFDSRLENIRDFIHPFLETVPDAGRGSWNPCDDRDVKDDQAIQKKLSCLARDHRIYIVASLGEKSRCTRRLDHRCHDHGYFHYSTTVVFSKEGKLVAKYRRHALLHEPYFDSPDDFNVVTFETSENTFAIVSSYDTMLAEPVKTIINDRKVRNIIIPNAWKTESPLLSSLQWHSSFAIGNEVNVLAATLHEKSIQSYGSGIYFPYRKSSYYNKPDSPRGELIIENVEENYFLRKKKPVIPHLSVSFGRFEYFNIKILGQNVNFKSIELSKYSDNVSICSSSFCCRVDYSSQSLESEKYSLGIFKGFIKALNRRMSYEICTVINCDRGCGQNVLSANTYFTRFSLSGFNFTADNIYPQMVFLDKGDQVLDDEVWRYEHGKMASSRIFNNALHSATMIGRIYREDKTFDDQRPRYTATNSNRSRSDAVSGFTPTIFVVGMATILSITNFS